MTYYFTRNIKGGERERERERERVNGTRIQSKRGNYRRSIDYANYSRNSSH